MSIPWCDFGLVVLGAGRSERMGEPKALTLWQGRPLLEHLLSPPLLCELGDVVVVLGHHADLLRPVVERLGFRHVTNRDPDRGRTSSVQCGLTAVRSGIRGVFVQPVDCPIVMPETYAALAAALGEADVAVPAYRGKRGHPPLVSRMLTKQILAAKPDVPLRELLQAGKLRRVVVEVEDPGVLVNIDRREDLRQLAGP